MAGLGELAARWRADLAAWAIPEPILAAAAESPWGFPTAVFARRADRAAARPDGPSFEAAQVALRPAGSVLDVGAGAGAASLPLLPWCTSLTAVDTDVAMLGMLAERARAAGQEVAIVAGRWPAVAAEVPAADVVTCHHVLYNVPDLEPAIRALTERARRRVVVEVSAAHPMSWLNPLWLRFHGLDRPERPTGDDILAICAAMGLRVEARRWLAPAGQDYASFAELADLTRRRLCLPPDRTADVGMALAEAGLAEQNLASCQTPGRETLTIAWDGAAAT